MCTPKPERSHVDVIGIYIPYVSLNIKTERIGWDNPTERVLKGLPMSPNVFGHCFKRILKGFPMSILTEVLFTILSYGPKISRSLLKYAYDNKP